MARNLLLLASCQAVGQAVNSMMFVSTVLAITGVLKQPDWATAPLTLQHVGVMLSVFPTSMLMQRVGRKFGFRLGSVFGMVGSAVCATGLYYQQLYVLLAGGLILGYAVANLQMYRFAAVELVDAANRANNGDGLQK